MCNNNKVLLILNISDFFMFMLAAYSLPLSFVVQREDCEGKQRQTAKSKKAVIEIASLIN